MGGDAAVDVGCLAHYALSTRQHPQKGIKAVMRHTHTCHTDAQLSHTSRAAYALTFFPVMALSHVTFLSHISLCGVLFSFDIIDDQL